MFNASGGFTFKQVLEFHQKLNKVCKVEFLPPDSKESIGVIARLYNRGSGENIETLVQIGTELTGDEPGARGRPGITWEPLAKTTYNLPGCTGKVEDFSLPRRQMI